MDESQHRAHNAESRQVTSCGLEYLCARVVETSVLMKLSLQDAHHRLRTYVADQEIERQRKHRVGLFSDPGLESYRTVLVKDIAVVHDAVNQVERIGRRLRHHLAKVARRRHQEGGRERKHA